MKRITTLLVLVLTIAHVRAQSQLQWRFILKVVGEDEIPIAGANASVGFYSNSTPASINGTTDTNGIFAATNSVVPSFLGYDLGFGADKKGYYSANEQQHLGPTYEPAQWNQTVILSLKKIVNPIPMYARWVRSEPPIFKKWGRPPIAFTNSASYDFVAGDWVAPNGKGAHADIIFTEEFNKQSVRDVFYRLIVSFPNKGDGIQVFQPTKMDLASAKAGGLLSSHEAPEDGYQPTLEQNQSEDPNRDYFFRVHTVLDENGNIKSALYGKIYGDFMQFSYYLDPTPNDRNIEFDPGHNLLGDVPSYDQVRQP